jgi:hypothetical protein
MIFNYYLSINNEIWSSNVIGNRLIAAIQNQRNSFSRGFPLPFNVETFEAFGALFQIPQCYRKFWYYKTKMLCNYVINIM